MSRLCSIPPRPPAGLVSPVCSPCGSRSPRQARGPRRRVHRASERVARRETPSPLLLATNNADLAYRRAWGRVARHAPAT